jgi:hypothetical protein
MTDLRKLFSMISCRLPVDFVADFERAATAAAHVLKISLDSARVVHSLDELAHVAEAIHQGVDAAAPLVALAVPAAGPAITAAQIAVAVVDELARRADEMAHTFEAPAPAPALPPDVLATPPAP